MFQGRLRFKKDGSNTIGLSLVLTFTENKSIPLPLSLVLAFSLLIRYTKETSVSRASRIDTKSMRLSEEHENMGIVFESVIIFCTDNAQL